MIRTAAQAYRKSIPSPPNNRWPLGPQHLAVVEAHRHGQVDAGRATEQVVAACVAVQHVDPLVAADLWVWCLDAVVTAQVIVTGTTAHDVVAAAALYFIVASRRPGSRSQRRRGENPHRRRRRSSRRRHRRR